ncbi:MAG: hypothetical protein HY854_10660 [Burkholderiales bacterium]|nr:hypothetical protein [Burkholderiales bacterium]
MQSLGAIAADIIRFRLRERTVDDAEGFRYSVLPEADALDQRDLFGDIDEDFPRVG